MASPEEDFLQKLLDFGGDLSVQHWFEHCVHAQYDQSVELTAEQTKRLALGIIDAMLDASGQPLAWPRARRSQKYPVVYRILRCAMEWLTGRRIIFEGIPKVKANLHRHPEAVPGRPAD